MCESVQGNVEEIHPKGVMKSHRESQDSVTTEDTEATLQKDPFYEQFKYFFLILRAAGRLPYMKRKTGEFYCAVLSRSTVFSVFMISALSYSIYLLTFGKDWEKIKKGTYDKVIRYWLRFVFLSPQVFAIVYTPWETPKIVKYMNHWRQYNMHFFRVIGSPLPTCLKRSIPITITTTLIALAICGFIEAKFLLLSLPWYQNMAYVFICSLNIILMIYWYFVCLYITHAGKILSDSLVKILEMNPSGQQISEFRHLWLELCDLSLELPSSMLLAVLSVFISIFIAFVFCCYGCFTELFQQHFYTFVEFMLPLIICMSIFIGYCDGAYKVRQKLGFEVLEAILFCKLLPLKEGARQEMELLLDAIETNPPVMQLAGLFTINRNILVQIVSMSTTYLVVLLQFKITADSPGGISTAQANLSTVFKKE